MPGRWRRSLTKELLARNFYPSDLVVSNEREHYGVLSYMPSSNAPRYASLGDEFQSLAAAQFLPRVDGYVPRDELDRLFPAALGARTKQLVLIMAARFYGAPKVWPPPSYIKPVFVGFRIEPANARTLALFAAPASLDYLRRHAPIGCRDLDTCKFFEALGVPAVLTGCLTLTLQRQRYFDANLAARQQVLAINVPDNVFALLPAELRARALRLVQELPESAPQTQEHRTQAAKRRLSELASAALVITTRLHATLPCVAFSTPVVLVDEGDSELTSRTTGVSSMFHVFRMGDHDFAQRFTAFAWLASPPNPDRELHATLVRRATAMLPAAR